MSEDLTGSPYDFQPQTSRGCLARAATFALSLALFALVDLMALFVCVVVINFIAR